MGKLDAEQQEEFDADGERRRLCIATREVLAVEALIRFVAAPDGRIVADPGSRLPGRGVWVACSRTAVAAAQRTGAFARSLKRPVVVPGDLARDVEDLLRKRALAALSIANKAGAVVAGFAKVEALLSSGSVQALVHAREAARDGVEKLDRRLAARVRDTGSERPVLRGFTIEELSLALGRSNVVHAALRQNGASQKFLKEAERLQRYRDAEEPEACQTAPVAPPSDDSGSKAD